MICCESVVKNVVDVALFLHNNFIFCCGWFQYLYYYLRDFSCLGSSFFWFKKALIPLYLSRDKTTGQLGKNTTLTPTKTLPKK